MKSNNTVRITFCVSEDRKKKIKELSHKAQVNVSQWLNTAISNALDKKTS